MKVLFVVSECVPFVKSGGLADVAGALPKELKRLGTDIRVILPKYGQIPERFRSKMKKVKEIVVPVGWRRQYCGIEQLEFEGITYYLSIMNIILSVTLYMAITMMGSVSLFSAEPCLIQ